MKKRSILLASGVAATAAVLWLLLRPSAGDRLTLETAPAVRIAIRNSVTATGTVEPVTEVEVGTQVSGIIDKLYADYNDVVKAGQLIAEMDKVTLQAELESAQAELAASETEYEYQLKNYTRTRTLHEKELVSDAEGRAVVRLTPTSADASPAGEILVTVDTAAMRPESLRYDYDGEQVGIAVLGVAPLDTPLKAFSKGDYKGYEFIDFR